jgi:hypothetical protein
MADIKPIETYYNGYRFRSRLEARWAVFFDEIGIKYEYELEGLEMNGVKYLPDFYLPEFRCLFEVKRGGVFERGVPKQDWMDSDDYKKIMAITESVKIKNSDKNFDYIVLASGSPYDCLMGKPDCGLLFNGIVGVMKYANEEGGGESEIIPLTEKDGLPLWGHIPLRFEHIELSKSGDAITFFGKSAYKDFKDSEHKHEIVPIGARCASLIAIIKGIIPRYRGEALFDPDKADYIGLDTQDDTRSPLYSACLKARQARFEYGETPKLKKEKEI